MAKLIDILARELKVWPHSDDASASQYPDKEIAFFEHSDQSITTGYASWSGNGYISGSLIALKDLASYWKTAKVTRAEWQAAVDALNAPKVVEWDGAGRPPVGVNVNIRYKGVIQGTGIVLFYGEETCLIKNTTKYLEREQFGVINDYTFTPIRTAEQVAVEEREKAIKEMMQHGVDAGDSTIEYSCAALYDAGYRKQ